MSAEIQAAIDASNSLISRSKDLIRERAAFTPLPYDETERIRAILDSKTCWHLGYDDARSLLREIDRRNSLDILNP